MMTVGAVPISIVISPKKEDIIFVFLFCCHLDRLTESVQLG
jgi:hypothetical protein